MKNGYNTRSTQKAVKGLLKEMCEAYGLKSDIEAINTKHKGIGKMNYTIKKTIGNETLKVNIRFDDECHNGHPNFAITGELYEGHKEVSFGCIHEEIQRFFGVEFDDFIALHLSDHNGVPMHAIGNMRYHMGIGEYNEKMEKSEFCTHYRITPSQYDILLKADDETHFYVLLQEMGILAEWQNAANNAISRLETLTGTKYNPVEYERSNLVIPSADDIALYHTRKAEGYYSQKDRIAQLETCVRTLRAACRETVQNCKDALTLDWDYDMERNPEAEDGWKSWRDNSQQAVNESLAVLPDDIEYDGSTNTYLG
jgi:hypothetical protein